MLSKASLTFMVAALLLFHLAVHFYLRFLLIVTNDKPTSQQNRRLCDAMVLVARTRVLVTFTANTHTRATLQLTSMSRPHQAP